MNEAIARLTRTVEEKDLQIAALVNRLEAQDGEKLDPEDEPTVEIIDVKPEPDQAAALMRSLYGGDNRCEAGARPSSGTHEITFYPAAVRDDHQHHQGTVRKELKYLRVILKAVFKED
ncbi:hypothetical protein FF1_024554 [Malus domestica]